MDRRITRISATGAGDLLLALLLCVALAGTAMASDGRFEISQACAVNTGCFPGDTLGFPVTIEFAGSYLLTSNLDTQNVNARVIEVRTSKVTVDLGGFEIRGVTTCSGTPLACAPLGASEGVAVQNTFLDEDVRVINGTVTGMGNHGVVVGVRGVVENVNATQNGSVGIFGDRGSILRNNTVGINGNNGLHGALYSTITGNSTYQNGANGIFAGVGALVSGNNATRNAIGIVVGDGSTVTGNTAYLNRFSGIEGGDGSLIFGNTASSSGGLLPLVGDGIRCGEGCSIRGNAAHNNVVHGLFLGTESAYRENDLSGNLTNPVNVITPGDPRDVGGNYIPQ